MNEAHTLHKSPYGHVENMNAQSALAYACNVLRAGKFLVLMIALVDPRYVLACLTAELWQGSAMAAHVHDMVTTLSFELGIGLFMHSPASKHVGSPNQNSTQP
jgi:hypothetical protein